MYTKKVVVVAFLSLWVTLHTDSCTLTNSFLWVTGLHVWLFFITLPPVQLYAIFRGFISISGEWVLLCKELITAEDSSYITIQCITTFQCSLGVLAGVSVLWHSPSHGVLAGVSVLWHSPSLGVLAGVNVLWHSPSLGVLAGVSVLWHSPSLGVLAGVSVLWHSASYIEIVKSTPKHKDRRGELLPFVTYSMCM